MFCLLSLLCIGAMGLVLPVDLLAGKPVVIEKPKPTHIEKDSMYIQLQRVGSVEEDIDDQNFFGRPTSVMPDDRGGFFVFDAILDKVFSFDKNLKLRKAFIDHGIGPFEIRKKEGPYDRIYFSRDGNLYVISAQNQKIISFTSDAKPIREFRLYTYPIAAFLPVVDKSGNLFTISPTTYGIDVLDKNLKLKYRLLKNGEVNTYLMKAPTYDPYFPLGYPTGTSDLQYDVLLDGRLIVYSSRSSTIYIFKEGKLLKQANLWPERLFPEFLNRIEKSKTAPANMYRNVTLFANFFVDKDNESFFYLSAGSYKSKRVLYCFDLNFQLVQIYFFYPTDCKRIVAKQNKVFYGVTEIGVALLKIKK